MDPNHVTIGSAVFICLALLGFWRNLDGKLSELDRKLGGEIKELNTKLESIRAVYHEQDKRILALEIKDGMRDERTRGRND